MNIALIGYRGTGKTTISKGLAKQLDRKLISIDKLIEQKVGPIFKFVEANGWDKFRYVEQEVIKEIEEVDAIIDCGGGTVEKEENITKLKVTSKIVLLTADLHDIKERIKHDKNRPALTKTSSEDEVESVLNSRKEKYKKAADFIIDTSKNTFEQATNKILEWYNEQ